MKRITGYTGGKNDLSGIEWINRGMLIIRLVIGFMFMLHGWTKITGGPEKWESLGEEMSVLGIHFGFTFWGFMAAFSEFFGGLLFSLGIFTRITAFLMFFTMLVATVSHFVEYEPAEGKPWSLRSLILSGSHSLEVGIVFFAFIFTGPGKYSLDRLLFDKDKG